MKTSKRIISSVIVLVLMLTLVFPCFSVKSSAWAPTSYTTITAGSSAYVSGYGTYFRFVPTESGEYQFYSSNNSGDPVGMLYDSNGDELYYSDDYNSNNFMITYDCVAGNTYYIRAYFYNNGSGSCTFNVVQNCTTVTGLNIVAGSNTYSLFNSGVTGSGYGQTTTPNPAPHTANNNGYDLYGCLPVTGRNSRFRLGQSFTVAADITEQATLTIRAYDVDEDVRDCGNGYEYDYVYLIDETDGSSIELGHLSGTNNTWANSSFRIAPSNLKNGHTYHFEVQMTCTGSSSCNYYSVVVRTVSLLVSGSGGTSSNQGIQSADLEASISSSGMVSTNFTVSSNEDRYYTIEYKVVDNASSAQRGFYEQQIYVPANQQSFSASFYLDSGSSRGNYTVTVYVKDSSTGMVIATRDVTVGYGYATVSYNSNGGTQNLPVDTTAYNSGNSVDVLFDYLPSKEGFTFLGWARSSSATTPEFTADGNTKFIIDSSDVTLYAVWAVAEHVHVPGEWIYDVEPTCYTGGHRHNYCATCEELLVDEDVGPAGHDFVVISEQSATCTEDGFITMECDRDGCDHEKTQVLIAAGHEFGTDNFCDVCGFELNPHEHEFSEIVVEPTCTEVGYTLYVCNYTSSCGYQYRDNFVDQKGHTWNDGVVFTSKTCTEAGVMIYTCTECNDVYEAEIPAGHEWIETVTLEASCTEDGNLHRECYSCGAVEDEVIPAAHTWDEGSVNADATCTEPGSKTCTCTVCGTVEDIEIDVLGHEFRNGECVRCGATIPDVINPDNDHPEYGMYFEIDDILSNYGPALINEYGVLLDYNSDANIKKVAVFLTQEGTMWRRCIAVVGENITYATYVPYLSYNEEIHYSGLNSDWINIFRLSENSDGIWCYSNYVTIGVNLEDAEGNLLLSLYDIGEAGAKTRIFDDLEEMIEWLKDEDGCIYHTPGNWIVDSEPTTMTAGQKHKECTECGEIVETAVIPPVAIIEIEDVVARDGSTVTVEVNIRNNPGIIGAQLSFNYDSSLTLISATAGGAWSALNMTHPAYYDNPCTFVWDGTSNDTSNGTIITLTFELPAGASHGTQYYVSAYYDDGDVINEELDPVEIEIIEGIICVDNYSLGDANDDGVVDVEDLIYLRRYLAGGYGITVDTVQADMDSNGEINIADVVLLRQYIVS